MGTGQHFMEFTEAARTKLVRFVKASWNTMIIIIGIAVPQWLEALTLM
jgi:hypothetical protein